MEIKLSVRTMPLTLTRENAARNVGRSKTIIDRAIKRNEIDFGRFGRNVLIVVNDKWEAFLFKHRK